MDVKIDEVQAEVDSGPPARQDGAGESESQPGLMQRMADAARQARRHERLRERLRAY